MQHEHSDDDATLLRQHGLRVTPARLAVLTSLDELQHGTPEQVHGLSEKQLVGISLSTVYRTLESFADLGIVTRADLGAHATTYALHRHGDHAHLICRGCGDVLSADADAVEAFRAAVLAADGFEIDTHHLPLFGRCATCRAAT